MIPLIKKVAVGLAIMLALGGLTYSLVNSLMYSSVEAAVPEPYADPHGQYTSGTPKCAKCHSGHSAAAQGAARLTSQRETCYACHDGSNASPDIRRQFGEETIGSSVYAGAGSLHPVPTGQQVCTKCHDPHLANETAPGGTASLLSVGPSKISSGNAVCGYCHGPGSNKPGGDMLTPFTNTAHDVYMTNPSSGTQIKCSRCHQPHGSPYDALLRTQVVSQEGGVYDVTGNNNTLCYGCHTNPTGLFSGKSIYEQTKHGMPYSSVAISETSKADFSQGTLTNVAATLSGDLTLGGNPGLRFDGINDQLNLPSGYTSTQNTFTYEFWAKPVTSTHEIDAESTSGTLGTNGQRYAIGAMNGGDTGQAGVGVSIGTNGISVYEHATSYMPALLVYSASITDWVHIAIVYNNKTPSLYINGQFVKTGLTSPKIPIPSQRFGWGDYGYYNGSLDDIRLWNYARTQTQIQSDMYKQLAGNESGLIGYWKLNEGSGTTVSDSAGTNHGTTVNGPVWNQFSASGNRISPEFNLPAVTAVGSQIRWNSYTPASTTLTVDTNVFLSGVWQGWQPVTNGGTIPGISNGTDLSGGKIKYRANLSTSDSRVTPWLHDVSIDVNHISTVAESVYPGTGYQRSQCLNCHEPHGKTGIADYRRADGNALCTTCHDAASVTRPANYSYLGIDTYNTSAHGSAETIPSSYIYNLSSAGSLAWESSGLAGGAPTPGSPGTEATSIQKGYASTVNSSFWSTGFATAEGSYNYQMYKFHIAQDKSNLRQIRGKWIGYGEPTASHPTDLLIWNNNTSTWDSLATGQLGDPNSPGTLSWTLSTAVQNYMDDSNDVYILARALHDGTGPSITGVSATVAGTSAIVNFTTNETATSYVYYGTVNGVYPNWVAEGAYGTTHAVPISGLTSDTDYYYKIQAYDKLGNKTDYTGQFHTSYAPSTPTGLVSPSSDPNPGNYVTVALSWTSSIDLDPTDTVSYQIEVYVDGGLYISNTSTTNSYNAYLGYDSGPSTVSWRVRAKDNHGLYSAWSATSSFVHTGPTPPPPTSCPNLYVWNGSKYEFVTDMAAASLGKVTSQRRYQTIYPDLPVVIPRGMLQEKDGQYEIKVKSERDEVDFIDSYTLVAFDHPAGTEIAGNDLVRGSEPSKIYAYNGNLRPLKSAAYYNEHTYSGGKTEKADVTELVSSVDGREAEGFYGDDNQFTFDLGDLTDAQYIRLVMRGWTKYRTKEEADAADEKLKKGIKRASTFYEVLQPDGTWKKEGLQHFSGLPKTVVLDLTGKFPKGTKKYVVRLHGMMRVRIDYVGVDTAPEPKTIAREISMLDANLAFRGSSTRGDEGKWFDYYKLAEENILHEGKFTKYGDVMPLLQEIDDKLVVMDTGDELTMHFKALPPPAPGMVRTFVLKPYEYYKEYEMATVEPMPFRKMDIQKLPESLGTYPAELKTYVAEWNTRVHHAREVIKPGIISRIKQFFADLWNWPSDLWKTITNKVRMLLTETPAVSKKAQVPGTVSALAAKPSHHFSLNTDYIELDIRAVDPAVNNGYCGNCHAVHGKDDGTGTLIPKQLRLPKAEVCFGGANGACHSSSDNSDRNVNIKDKFAGSNILSHHSINPAEYAAGGDSKLECVNCHDPHLNNAANKLVDPQSRYTAYTVYNDVSKYIGPGNEVYVLVKARHDGKAPVINVNPTTTNAATSATVDWWTDEPSSSLVYYGTDPGSLGGPAGNSSELVTHHIVNVTGLAAGTNYYFKVRSTDAVNNYVESSVYQMDETDPVIPAAPVVSSGGTSATITWSTNEPATSLVDYMPSVEYAVYNDFIGPSVVTVQGDSNGYVTSHTVNISGLTPGESYKARVRSDNYRGRGVTSLVSSLIYASQPPYPPTGQNGPDYISDYTSDHTVTMTWNATSDPDGDSIAGYYVELSRGSTFNPSIWPVYSTPDWQTGTSWTTNINNDGLVTWYWRVKAKDNWNAQSVWSAVYSFQHQGYEPPATTTSCPNLYVWDGKKYQFVTDISGATIGKKNTSTGKYTDIFPGLNVAIPWNMLQEKDGRYILKVKSERDEVDFIDSIALTAVDHPVGTRVALNDLMRGKEPNKIYTYSADIKPVKKAIYVNNPIYTGGKPTKPLDITDLISEADGKEAIGVFGDDNQFTFELGDLSEAKEIKLVLVGWTEWSSKQDKVKRVDKLAKGTKRAKTFMEILQPDGTWKQYPLWQFNSMVKTSVLDLTGKFPKGTKDYVVRLRGMHKPHMDYAGLDTSPQAEITLANAKLLDATLGYRGASVLSEDQRFFDYYKVMKEVTYHEGKFTRFGNVLPLVNEEDDRQVVMDSGDELTLHFKALPPPAPGMTRSFILRPLVYYKEYEMAKVEPMPFRKLDMNKLPHSLGEYPAEAKEFMAKWNTREHKAGERYRTTSQRITEFFSKMGDYITTAWKNTFARSEKDGIKRNETKGTDTGNSPLTYKLYKDSPYAGFKADKDHYSLNTNYVMLRTDSLKDVRNFYSDSANFGMWEHNVEPNITTNKGTDRTAWASKVRNSDADRWTTDYYPSNGSNDGDFNYQMYKFVITDAAKDVSNLLFYWTGRGEPSPGYNVHFSLWDFQANGWTEVKQQSAGTEQSLSFTKYVDYNSYCYKCHSGTVPSGVQLGTINGQAIRNIGSSYPTDKHGSDNAGQGGFSDPWNGYFDMAWRVTSLGSMKSPYARGHANLPCADCHDLHGSQNVYHLRENPNGVSVGAIPANTSTATNNQVEAWCQACHQGNRAQFHDYCLQCHNGIGQGHYGWYNYNATQADFNAPCLSCHKHGGATGPHSYGGCHCGLDYTVKSF